MDSSDSTCLVCHEMIEVYAIGVCDHAICFKCSTRLRALCDQFYCPICRTDLPEVFFMSKRESFGKMPMKNFIRNRKLKLQFENQDIRDKFEELLEHRCKICKNRYPEKSFRALKDHMSRSHTLFYCTLCLELKIFTSERKLYTRQELAAHRRVGDKDDTSYKGHPLCEFCDERYLDKDELYKHLRKDHYFCHFCESLGSQEFFDNYEVLRQHFQKEHYLCVEGECANVQFENAFRSQIDYQSHLVTHHSKAHTKQQSRQERTINIDINLVPRPSNRGRGVINGQDYEEVNKRGPPRYQGGRGGKYKRNMDREDRDMERAMQASLSTMKENKPRTKEPEIVEEEKDTRPVLHDEQAFPSLGGASVNAGDNPTSVVSSETDMSRASLADRLAMANNMSVQHGVLGLSDFPDLKPYSSPVNVGVSIPSARTQVMKKSKHNAGRYSGAASNSNVIIDDFPELPSSKKPAPEPSGKWKQQDSVNKNTPKDTGVTKHHQQHKKKSDLSSSNKVIYEENDFPSLGSSNEQKSQSVNSKWLKSVDESSSNKMNGRKNSPTMEPREVYERFSPVNVPNSDNNDNKSKTKKKKKKEKTEINKEKDTVKSNSCLNNIANMLISNSNSNSSENISTHVQLADSLPDSSSASVRTTTDRSAPELNPGKQNNEKPCKKEDKIEKKRENEAVDNVKPNTKVTSARSLAKIALTENNFPSLGTPAKPLKRAPPGFKNEQEEKPQVKAPPGLQKSHPSAPPPGFAITKELSIKNDIYSPDSVLSSNHTVNFEYAQPDGFSERNKLLIGTIQAYCSDDQSKFNDFKVLSGEFRKGEIPASLYYQRCQDILGANNFTDIFPELLTLLPDIDRQQQLLAVYMEREGLKKDDGVLKISGKSKMCKGAWTVTDSGFLTCQTCRQVLARKDYNNHLSTHSLDTDFPSLGGDRPSLGVPQGSWVKAK